MKRSELYFSTVRLPIDFLMLLLAAITAFNIRHFPEIMDLLHLPKLYAISRDEFLGISLAVIPFFVAIYALEGLYVIRVTRTFSQEAYAVFKATTIGLVIIIVAVFLKREWFSSRFIILSAWLLAVLYVSFARLLLQSLQRYLLVAKGVGTHRVLLINGAAQKTRYFRDLLRQSPELGYRVVETISDVNMTVIKDIRKKKGIDAIILCDPSVPDDQQEKLIDYCSIHNISYNFVPTFFQTARFDIRMLGGEPLFEMRATPLDGWGHVAKRAFDIVAASVLVVLATPILAVTAILVRLDSKGPVIFKNERIGSDGKKFFLYKFRYMKWEYCTGTQNPLWKEALEREKKLIKELSVRSGPLYKIKNDPRKTRVGKIIERFSIDELPQLFNVLKGEMSIVGPRPHQEREVNKYREYHRRLLTIKPGITGMAQVVGRSDLNFEDEYRLDVYYIENWSLWLDILLCLKTAGVLFRRRKN